jgi:hypothetical protein
MSWAISQNEMKLKKASQVVEVVDCIAGTLCQVGRITFEKLCNLLLDIQKVASSMIIRIRLFHFTTSVCICLHVGGAGGGIYGWSLKVHNTTSDFNHNKTSIFVVQHYLKSASF